MPRYIITSQSLDTLSLVSHSFSRTFLQRTNTHSHTHPLPFYSSPPHFTWEKGRVLEKKKTFYTSHSFGLDAKDSIFISILIPPEQNRWTVQSSPIYKGFNTQPDSFGDIHIYMDFRGVSSHRKWVCKRWKV